MIGIISYLPQDDKLRATRVKNATRQIEWLKQLFPEETPFVVAQGYTENEKLDGVEYDIYEKGIGSHNARNVILEKFYASNDKWLLIMDDDVAVYDYYDSQKFIRNVYFGKIEIESDIILPLQPETSSFKELNIKNGVQYYYTLSRSSATNCPNMMLLRNGLEKVFFDNTIDLLADDAVPDDNKFIVNCIALGMRVHRADFWIKKSMDRDKSVIYSTNKEENYAQHSNLGKNLAKYVTTTYNVESVQKFNKMYNKAVPIRLKRDKKYELPESLILKKTSKKGLF